MGRRKKELPLLDVLVNAPWWMSVILAVGVFVVLYWIAPPILAGNPFLVVVAAMLRTFAWLPAVLLCVVALLSAIRERQQRRAENARFGHSPGLTVEAAQSQRPVRRKASVHAGTESMKAGPVPARRSESAPTAEWGRMQSVQEVSGWSVEVLEQLEWKRFELLCVWYYELMGFTVKTVPHGADGGIDATLYKDGLDAPVAVVQCKAWRTAVKVEPVRALGGSMHAAKVKRGVFWSRGGFVGQPVQQYAADAGIQLLDGAKIVERILALDLNKQVTLLARAFEGDYRTPTCPACGVKLVRREGKSGVFWGCHGYPSCRVTLPYSE